MDPSLPTSSICKLMVINNNCLIVNSGCNTPSNAQNSLILTFYSLINDTQKPLYQIYTKSYFGNKEVST